MSNIRYLEIDSSYRNREMYPEPADFIVPISQYGTKNILDSTDPVSLEAPLRIWCPADYGPVVFPDTEGKVAVNDTNSLSQFIVYYDKNKKKIKDTDYYNGTTIEVGTSTNSTVITGWDFLTSSTTNDYFIVTLNEKLTGVGVLTIRTNDDLIFKFNQGTKIPDQPIIFIPNGVEADNYYTDYIIYNQTQKEWRRIVSYNGKTKLAGLDISTGSIANWNISHTLVLRKDYPKEIGTLSSINNAINVTFPNTSSKIPGKYDGSFIRFTSILNNNKIFKITSYTGEPNYKATLKYISGSEDGTNVLNTLDIGKTYEILQYTRDNETPFVYTGSTVSQQEMSCYEIELMHLILPNQILVNGGRSVLYPYFYVELQNVSATGSGLTNIIYSNNPNSTKKLFRCPVDDMRNHLISPFIKIDSERTRQTVKFKPNDSLHFAVYLPNGKLFKTMGKETYSPEYPNPFLQISACFSIKRL
jgi:hypothetical protein